jgi:polyisoprenoid-binding protein YceI
MSLTPTTTTTTTTATAPPIPAGEWTVDPVHTRIGFVARHLMVTKVRGSFSDFTAEVEIAENPLDSALTAEVQMASIDTRNTDRDGHLRTNDFFDIERYPTMTLRATRFERSGDRFTMLGDLTIKGVTRPVEFALEFDGVSQDPWGGTRAGFSASAVIDRTDFGIEFNATLETGGVLVGEKVQIELDVQLVRS